MAKKAKRIKKPKRLPLGRRRVSIPPFAMVQKLETRLHRVAAAIVQEIVDEMNLKVAAAGKTFEPNALVEWRPELLKAVLRKLLNGGNWNADRANVLIVAGDMATISAILANGLPKVAKNKAHAAFRAVKDHQTCPNPPGSGAWCNFDI